MMMMQAKSIGRLNNFNLYSIRHMSNKLLPITTSAIDHVCIVTKDINASIKWYKTVLGMTHNFTDAKNFYPTCSESPAMLQQGNAKVAILPLTRGNESPFTKRRNFGEHFALNISRSEFSRAEKVLPLLLKENSPDNHDTDVEACDYGHQLSLFFKDLD